VVSIAFAMLVAMAMTAILTVTVTLSSLVLIPVRIDDFVCRQVPSRQVHVKPKQIRHWDEQASNVDCTERQPPHMKAVSQLPSAEEHDLHRDQVDHKRANKRHERHVVVSPNAVVHERAAVKHK
jgi:hypothetical protein